MLVLIEWVIGFLWFGYFVVFIIVEVCDDCFVMMFVYCFVCGFVCFCGLCCFYCWCCGV